MFGNGLFGLFGAPKLNEWDLYRAMLATPLQPHDKYAYPGQSEVGTGREWPLQSLTRGATPEADEVIKRLRAMLLQSGQRDLKRADIRTQQKDRGGLYR